MLTQNQIDSFKQDGYLVVNDVLEKKVLDKVCLEYEELMDKLYSNWYTKRLVPPDTGMNFYEKLLASYKAGCDWFQPMDISFPGDRIKPDTPFHIGPAVFDMVTSDRLLDMVEDLIGPEITSNPIQHVRLKPPTVNLHKDEFRAQISVTDWHQDRAVALEEADNTKMITVWLAISDATVENGCLRVIPGKPKMYPHCPKKQATIADGFLDESIAVSLPVKAGGAVIFHPLTPHSSLENKSDKFRWSFDIRYNVTGQDSGRSHFPEIVVRSKTNPDSVLTDWKIWHKQWEDARVKLSGQPHIPIHRWKEDSPLCA